MIMYLTNKVTSNCIIPLSTKENTFSVTIDIVDVMFLYVIEECKAYHRVSPNVRGQHSLQLNFAYTSPDDSETYGSISVMFYLTTAWLLMLGSFYVLWIDGYIPAIYARAEHNLWKLTADGMASQHGSWLVSSETFAPQWPGGRPSKVPEPCHPWMPLWLNQNQHH